MLRLIVIPLSVERLPFDNFPFPSTFGHFIGDLSIADIFAEVLRYVVSNQRRLGFERIKRVQSLHDVRV